MSSDPAYDAWQGKTHAGYRELLARYTARPFGERHMDEDCEVELGFIEQSILSQPPMCLNEKGVWRPRKRGVIGVFPHDMTENRLVGAGGLPPVRTMSFAEANLKVIPEREIVDIISDPNRTAPAAYTEGHLDQRSVGSCSCEGSVRGLMNRRSADGQEHVKLNPWMPYSIVSGGVDRGSNPRDVMSFLQNYGCCSMAVRSRSRGWRPKPTDEEYQDALQYRILPDGLVWARNWPEARTLIALGFPVPFGYSGHWICGVDLISLTRLAYDNSWGKDWGDNGRGTISAGSIYWSYGVVGVLSVTDRRAA